MLLTHRADVGAGAERAPGAGDQKRADARVGVRPLEGLRQRLPLRKVERGSC